MHTEYTEFTEINSSKRSTIPLYIGRFVGSMSQSLFIPVIWPYIQLLNGGESILALAITTNLIGMLIGSVIFGHLHNKFNTKPLFIVLHIMGISGNVIFILAYYSFNELGIALLICSRLIEGIRGGGYRVVEASYISEAIVDQEQVKILSEMGIVAYCSLLLGSGSGILFNIGSIEMGYFDLNQFTWPPVVYGSLMMVGLGSALNFQEIPVNRRKGHLSSNSQEVKSPDRIGIFIGFFVTSIAMLGYQCIDTITVPILLDKDEVFCYHCFEWDVQGTYILLTIEGVVSTAALLTLRNFCDKFDHRKIIAWSLAVMIGSCFLLIDYQNKILIPYLYLAGYYILGSVCCIAGSISVKFMSSIIGPFRSGQYMGLAFAFSTLVGCISATWSAHLAPISLQLCFGGIAAIVTIILAALLLFWKRCSPHSYLERQESKIA